jgi:putative transposase
LVSLNVLLFFRFSSSFITVFIVFHFFASYLLNEIIKTFCQEPYVSHRKNVRGRNRYHTDFKIEVKFGLVPPEELRKLPKSTRHGFINDNYSDFIGNDKSDDTKNRIEFARKMARSDTALRLYQAYNHIKNTIISVYSSVKNIRPHLSKYKEKIVHTILRVKPVLGLDRACRYFGISKSRFHSWLFQLRNLCTTSILHKCRRKWPNQITENEQNIMKRVFSDPFFKGWAVYQIAIHSLLNNVLAASANTWYKYIKVLGIHLHQIRKKKQKTGIQSDRPNGIWHMDVTEYKTLDNVKAYIYILIDNFSRFILNWKVSLVKSGKTCLDMVREGYVKHLEPDSPLSAITTLLADDGSENNNSDVDGFLGQPLVPIKKLIAQKDIQFSNSMVEAFNKKLKYQHLFPYDIRDFCSLEKHLAKAIQEYNEIRPHYAHKYLTPSQVYSGLSLDREEIRKRIVEAGKIRIIVNRNASCPVCAP